MIIYKQAIFRPAKEMLRNCYKDYLNQCTWWCNPWHADWKQVRRPIVKLNLQIWTLIMALWFDRQQSRHLKTLVVSHLQIYTAYIATVSLLNDNSTLMIVSPANYSQVDSSTIFESARLALQACNPSVINNQTLMPLILCQRRDAWSPVETILKLSYNHTKNMLLYT